MKRAQRRKFNKLVRYVSSYGLDLRGPVLKEGKIVELEVQSAPIGAKWTKYWGALIQVLSLSGATVIVFSQPKPDVLRVPVEYFLKMPGGEQ